MGSRNTRIFNVDGKKVRFDSHIFEKCFDEFRRREKLNVHELEERLAEKLNVSPEAIHNWRFGQNGPGNADMLTILANELGLPDRAPLLKEIDGGNKMPNLNERQIIAAKKIYDVCIWFLSEFDNSDGFNDYWYVFKDKGSENPEEDIYELVEKKMNRVRLVLDREYFDLRDQDIYDEFCEFVAGEMTDMYDGKLGYAYRFEAQVDGNPTTFEDYEHAMKTLNAIIEKYT